jgi:eukaryotic-like serine/threonine-protein kinase
MTLAPGARVGPYEVVALIGEGGMGCVYRARDPRLDRDVALKVLRHETMGDPDRRARFVAEARAVSALNHPNIVTVHDVGIEGEMGYMVMEFVEGQPLDTMTAPRGLRPAEVVRIGAQVADALAEAHAARIVHRDLKPANVILQPNGRVKVLDFGLAKLVQPQGGASDRTMMTQTVHGVIVGTVAYMSPEQAEGKPLDHRSDIFSFGALLYELCTGCRAFDGESHASVLADVLRQDPRPVSELRPELPPDLARLIMRCLRKDPARRAQSMADLKVQLEDLREALDSGTLQAATPAAAGAAPAVRARRWPWLAVGAAAGAVVTLLATFAVMSPSEPATPESAALQVVPLTSYSGRELSPSFSPDGNQVAFSWTGERDDNQDIYVRLVGAGAPLRLTTDPRPDLEPEWSPDGRHIAFLRRVERELVEVMLVPALGGPERRLARLHTRLLFDNPISGLAWTPDAKFLLATGGRSPGEPSHLHRIAVATGETTVLVPAEEGTDGFHGIALSPDGRTLAAVRIRTADPRPVQLHRLTASWEVDGAPSTAPIDSAVSSLAWTADGRALVYRIAVNVPLPLYRIELPGGEPTPMPWVGADATMPAVSGAASRLAFTRNVRDTNIWRMPLEAGPSPPALEQIAVSSFREVFPQYSPDGRRLVFFSNRGGSVQIWTSEADGSGAAQLTNVDPFATTGSPRWSPDGRHIVFDSNAEGTYHLSVVSADGGQPRALTTGSANNITGGWSPDHQWIYFASDRSGRLEVWRMPAEGGAAEQVTRGGGQAPTVSPDNAWVYYTKGDGAGGLWRMPAAGGEERQVTEGLFRYSYAVTATAVYYVSLASPAARGTPGRALEIVRHLDLATGRTRDLLTLDKPADLGLAVSPDERFLLFTKLDHFGTDLMLVENFR